ncbi:MAG TPA: AtpZ/AtpI family protein [Planctomycetes bacterium]|nr:AtpZ/AtpI family protein [Planctomycetota bacterium]HIJ70880.1 AtpZ/AtpI family protein [Planctomycetota bacterium]
MEKDDRQKDKPQRSGLEWMGAGIEFCGVIAIFCYIGHRLDGFFNTGGPFLLVTGFFISFIGMMYLFYKESK